MIVTGTGELDLTSAVFHTPLIRALILTTEPGKRRLSQSGSEALTSVEVKTLSAAEERISPSAILTLLRREAGVELLLHEVGPTLFGEFLAAGFMDQLFLTVAPQIAGRDAVHPDQAWLPTFSFLRRRLLVEPYQRKKCNRLPLPALSGGKSGRIESLYPIARSRVTQNSGRTITFWRKSPGRNASTHTCFLGFGSW